MANAGYQGYPCGMLTQQAVTGGFSSACSAAACNDPTNKVVCNPSSGYLGMYKEGCPCNYVSMGCDQTSCDPDKCKNGSVDSSSSSSDDKVCNPSSGYLGMYKEGCECKYITMGCTKEACSKGCKKD